MPYEPHIRSAFDHDLDAVKAQVGKMGGLVEKALLNAAEALEAGDLTLAAQVRADDRMIDELEEMIQAECARIIGLTEMRQIPGAAAAIKRMTRAVVQMLSNALNAYFTEDAVLAEEVRQADREIDQLYNSLFREFLTHMMEDPRNITACMHLHFIAKNIERVGDHATGIAEQVLYLVTGRFPEDDRVKGEDMSLATTLRT